METDPPRDFVSLQEGIQKSLASTVKTVNRLAAEDLSFQRTVKPGVAQLLDDRAARVLNLSTRLLRSAAATCGIGTPTLQDAEDLDMRWQSVVDVVDSVLEKADMALDEYTGLVKRKEPPSAEPISSPKRTKPTNRVIRNANVTKPQALFERKPDNFPAGPWKPILTEKPHAAVPLKQSLVTSPGENGAHQYKHPYETEISNMKYADRLFQTAEPVPPQPAETTSATWVDTYEGVLDMLQELKTAKEIAVDLEHHDFRTYMGLVCLMQISSREKDWIVDTLQPWRHKLEVLNEVFADPTIVKVFHGAHMDMIWLQRDLGLYVNGLFDTYFACRLLSYPGKSLAFLLSKFVNFDADKQYQMADWRIRPIPAEMMYYARSDTHYLLYIYDHLRNELISASDRNNPERDYIGQALQQSKELALSRHEHPGCDEETGQGSRGWYNLVLKQSHFAFDGEQFSMFRALWKWRDVMARKEDESPNFVLGTNAMTSIISVNPPDIKALHSLLPVKAPLARAHFNEIWDRLQEAKSRGGPSLFRFLTSTMASDSAQEPGLPIISTDMAGILKLGDKITTQSLPRSQLFGGIPISSRWETAEQNFRMEDDYVPFPWQRYVQDISAGDKGEGDDAGRWPAGEAAATGAATVAEAEAVKLEAAEEGRDEEFTLRKGRKRKPGAVEREASASGEEDESSHGDKERQVGANGLMAIEDEPKDSKEQGKKDGKVNERLERARDKKRQDLMTRRKKQAQEEDGRPQEEQSKEDRNAPFDYSKAASVLHASRDPSGPVREPKVFDPYAKTADGGLKGARKAPPVRGERSATFKR